MATTRSSHQEPHPTSMTQRADRFLLIRPCRYEMTESHDGQAVMLHSGYALSVNVSDEGMLLMLPQAAQVRQVLEVEPPAGQGRPAAATRLAEVRWTKQISADSEGSLCLAGVRFLAAASRFAH